MGPELVITDFGGIHNKNGDVTLWKKVVDLSLSLFRILGMKENWIAIADFPGYEVSNLGNVRSFLAKVFWVNGQRGSKSVIGEIPRLLKPHLDDIGRRSVCLYRSGVSHRILIAKLVLNHFVGKRPKGKIVRHGPAGHSDDSVGNISWGTYSQNNGCDRHRDGTAIRGEMLPWSKLTKDKVLTIRSLLAEGRTALEISKRFNVTRRLIYDIRLRRCWAWI